MSSEHVTVRIYGENYPLRTDEGAQRLEQLARFVDARMREVAATGKVVVTSKIAVLAALHIADELFRLREGAAEARPQPAPEADQVRRVARLVEILDRAIAPPSRESS